jgi:large conductance mechanosensitive channel
MKNFFNEFKKFISRGNVVDMAVGVIIGGAFTSIVTSLVNDIFMPLIGIITGGIDVADMAVTVGGANLAYGAFLSAVINFLLIALIVFTIVKLMNTAKDKMSKKPEEAPAAPTTKKCPYCMSEIDIHATRCPHCTSEISE